MLLRHTKNAVSAEGDGMTPEMPISARFVFETPTAEKLYASLSPEEGCDPGEKSKVQLTHDADSVTLCVEAEDISAMRASLNMWLRLINVSNEVLEL